MYVIMQAVDLEIQAKEIMYHKANLNRIMSEYTGQPIDKVPPPPPRPHPFPSDHLHQTIITSKYPRCFVGTLQPQQADWKGRPRCFSCVSLMCNFSVWPPPRENPQVPI